MQNSDSSDDITNYSSISNDRIFQSDSSVQNENENTKKGSQSRNKNQIHELRNFWYREVQPNIMGDIRAVYFIKLLGPKFSWQFFASLSYLFKDLGMQIEKVQNFHESILDYFNKNPRYKMVFGLLMRNQNQWNMQHKLQKLHQTRARVHCNQNQSCTFHTLP